MTEREMAGKIQEFDRKFSDLEHRLIHAERSIGALVENNNLLMGDAQRIAAMHAPPVGPPVFPSPVQKARGNRPVAPIVIEQGSDG